MKKDIFVQFDKEAYEEYSHLQDAVKKGKRVRKRPTYNQLLTSINNAIRNLKVNPYYGDLIPRKYLTKKVVKKYGTNKIFRVELVGYWRLLYTIIGEKARIIAFILEYMNHDEYNKLFSYKKR